MASNNPPLLFIHGFRGNELGLKPVAERLAGFKTYVPTIPPAEKQNLLKYDASHYADWIASYITKEKLQQPVLIGHSMGSIIAAATAAKYPQLVNNKIILLAPISSKPNKFFAALSPLSAVLPNSIVDFITTKYLIVPKDKAFFNKVLDITHQCSASYQNKSEVFKTARFSVKHCIGDFDFKKDTLLLAGQTDRLISQKHTQALADKIGAKAIFLENAGHLLNYECPDATAKIITQFLLAE